MRVPLLALALAGCTLPDYVPPARFQTTSAFVVHGDTSFKPEERMIVELACERWRRFSGGRINLVMAWDLSPEALVDGDRARYLVSQARLLRVEHDDSRAARVQARLHPGEHALGFTTPKGVVPPIAGIVADRVAELYPVVLHELGHVAGLPELPAGERGVMSRDVEAWKFTEADWKLCVAEAVCQEA